MTRSSKREIVIRRYLPLVLRIASALARRLPRHVDVEDLTQAGALGLLEAADRYRSRPGGSFKSYAWRRIRGAMLDFLRQGDPGSRGLRSRIRRIAAARRRLKEDAREPPKDVDVAAAARLSLEQYYRAVQEAHACAELSIDAPGIGAGESEKPNGVLAEGALADEGEGPAGKVEAADLRRVLDEAMQALPRNEKIVMSLRYYQDLGMREIGARLSVTESRISQIHRAAVKRLRRLLQDGIRGVSRPEDRGSGRDSL